jgi:hypothetical protein
LALSPPISLPTHRSSRTRLTNGAHTGPEPDVSVSVPSRWERVPLNKTAEQQQRQQSAAFLFPF